MLQKTEMGQHENIFSERVQEKSTMRFENLITLLSFELNGLSRESVRGENVSS